MTRRKILWLCSWYPGKTDPFNGDFIQRHARAAAIYCDIHVIHLAPVTEKPGAGYEQEWKQENGLTEQLVYYYKSGSAIGKFLAHYRWLSLYKKLLRDYIRKHGKPDLVHVQIPMKAGIPALWLEKHFRIPFLITEHWGIYNDVAEDRFRLRSPLFRYFTRRIFSKATAFISVSRFLAEGVNQQVIRKEYKVIPNVADTRFFNFKEKEEGAFRFIHVSNMVPLKNAEGILRAFSTMQKEYPDITLQMVGDREPAIREFAARLGAIPGSIQFTGEIAYEEVAKAMQQADCLLLFSHIENSPCVIGEALCCGLPVIASRVGGIPELIQEGHGILVPAADETALINAMKQVRQTIKQYNRQSMAMEAASRFSYETAGRLLNDTYSSLLPES
jgi:glycosyltransferase involved in cell wall biosynthesis